jgi:type VI secretion system protein ImpC
MTKPNISFGKIQLGVTPESAESAAEIPFSAPFRIGILTDFTGRASRRIVETGAKMAARRPVAVDRDNFEGLMKKLGVELHLALSANQAAPLVIKFGELDDFRPDRIFAQLDVFESLHDTRHKLGNPATFAAAAAEVQSWMRPASTAQPAPSVASPAAPSAGGNLLEDMLGGALERPAEPVAALGGEEWSTYMKQVVGPYLVPRADPRAAELIAQVDSATSALMRAVLHHPQFQALEAAWRSLFFLVRRLETDDQLKLDLLDISRAELAADLSAGDDLRLTGVYRLWVEQTVGTPGGQPWAVLVGNYTFGPSHTDVEQLGRLAKIAQQAGAPFLAGATSTVAGCPSLVQTPDPDDWPRTIDREAEAAWNALRRLPESAYLGLALPRFLLRLPYGKSTDPIDSFEFEELDPDSSHESYLWGNPALIAGLLLGEAFTRAGWSFRPGVIQDVEGLPLHVRTSDGESETKPCAEVLLGHRAAAAIQDKGLMPLVSIQDRDAVRLDSFRSVADPPAPLAGRWK